MKNLKLGNLLASMALGVAMMGLGTPASATPTLSYGNLPTGTYYGTQNFDANWTIGSENGIVLGLNFKDRESFALLDGSSGTYYSALGTYPGSTGKQHTSYQFSVDYTNATSTAPLTFQLCVDRNSSLATSMICVDPTVQWVDNNVAPSPYIGFQNSQNIGFSETPGGAFNPALNGTFDFVLTAFMGTAIVDQVTARVQIGDALAVPEPGTIPLIALGVGLLAWAGRRTKRAG